MNTILIPRASIWLSLSLLILAPVGQGAQAPPAGRLRAGAAKVDITPEGPPETIRDRLYARAIYFEDGRSSAAIVTVDAGGVGNEIINAAVAQSSAATGVPVANYLISATHTHSGGGEPARTTAESCLRWTPPSRRPLRRVSDTALPARPERESGPVKRATGMATGSQSEGGVRQDARSRGIRGR